MNDAVFSQLDFGPLKEFLETDDITDISYSNGGQVWLKSLTKGIYQVDRPEINNAMMEKLAFQCSNVMGKTFNMASPFLDAESAELRMNFIHESISTNGIACVIRKTPAKIRLNKDKLINERYTTVEIHDFLIKCVHGHCNIIVSGETGSGKTEFVKYLAAHTKEDEKIITIEDTLELHLDRIFPHRDIVAMKTNNIASYSDVLVTCMRQNPKWILLSEVRSAEAVMAVRNSISSGHYILSTIHADKASSIPNRMYSLLETNQDINQFLKSIYRYIQLGVYIRGFQDKATKHFVREIAEVTEFYVTEDNEAKYNTIYRKSTSGKVTRKHPTKYLIDYLDAQGVTLNQNEIQDSETVVSRDFSVFAEEDKEKMQQQMVNQNPTTNQARPGIINNNQMPNVNQAKSNNQRVASQNVRVVPNGQSNIQTRQSQPRITPTSVIKAQPSVVQSQNQVVTNQPNINASSINQNKIENLESMFE